MLKDAYSHIKSTALDFPDSTADKNLLANVLDSWFDLWSGKIPPVMEQLSPRATTTEPVL